MKRVLSVAVFAACTVAAATIPRSGQELRFCVHGAPKTLDPLQASDTSSELIRYITAGSLVRLDRRTQQVMPELASSWRVKPGNREVEFTLRSGAKFSDGSAVTVTDVIYSIRKMMDRALRSPLADPFRFGTAEVAVRQGVPQTVIVSYPKPVAQLVAPFDKVPILSAQSPGAVSGPYLVANYKAGSEIELRRNPHYWRHDEHGQQLPYVAVLRIRVQTNREMELLDFERGDVDLVPELTPEIAERVAGKNAAALVDLGLSLDALVLWFNQVPGAALPDYKKAWFQSSAFRKALSLSINREDICRIAYRGKAKPGVGLVSPANRTWYNTAVKADPNDPAEALRRLRDAGFVNREGALFDAKGNPVEFSAMTNAGNRTHERVLGLIQQDWKRIGVKLTIVTLDFPSVIERITRTNNYEACMLPMTSVGMEPEDQVNVWLSSGVNHQWNPGQKQPATVWEKEIDEQMGRVSGSISQAERKRAFDRVQAIAAEQVPFLYLAHPQAQAAVSPGLRVAGAPIWPYLLWRLEEAAFRR